MCWPQQRNETCRANRGSCHSAITMDQETHQTNRIIGVFVTLFSWDWFLARSCALYPSPNFRRKRFPSLMENISRCSGFIYVITLGGSHCFQTTAVINICPSWRMPNSLFLLPVITVTNVRFLLNIDSCSFNLSERYPEFIKKWQLNISANNTLAPISNKIKLF